MFRFESPMVAVAMLPPPTSTHVLFAIFSVHSFHWVVHSIFPLTVNEKKKSLFQFFTHSLRLITTSHHYHSLQSFYLQPLGFYCREHARARSNHLKIYVQMITVVQLSRISYSKVEKITMEEEDCSDV